MSATLPLARPLARRRAGVPLGVAGAAGLGYVVAAGVENMELLRAPLRGAPAADVRAAYADQALASVTAAAGVLSLLLYVLFAAALAPRLPHPGRALGAAVAGAALALAGIAVTAPLLLDGGAGVTDAQAVAANDLQRALRMLAGPCMAAFLWWAATPGVVPRPLLRPARVIAVPLALTPLAVLADGHGAQVAAGIAFSLDALWIFLAAVWLCVGRGVAPAVFLRRAAFLLLVVAAGGVGVALLAVPRATGAFFAWGLAPPSLAAFAGGVYVGSAVVYACGLRAPWHQARALVGAAVVLSTSVLAATLLHLEVFDLDRLQAWAWLVLFAAFALVTSGLLLAHRGPRAAAPSPAAAPAGWARALLALAALGLVLTGAALWIDPAPLPPLGGRFAGSWAAMLGTVAGVGAVAGRRDELRLPGLALVALPAGALAAAARSGEGDLLLVVALGALAATGAAVSRAARTE